MPESDESLDRHVRQCLEPDQQSIERVKSRVLCAAPRRQRAAWAWALSVCAALVIALTGWWSWQSISPPADELTATFDGEVLVIRAPDGTGWILGPPDGTRPPAGTGLVVFGGERQ
jgi:hypothetical protein